MTNMAKAPYAWTASNGRTVCTVVPDLTRKRQYLWTVRQVIDHRLLKEGGEDDFEAAKAAARREARI